ncbi:MAG: hypothetical protein C4331_11110 [Meiothermus sp.]
MDGGEEPLNVTQKRRASNAKTLVGAQGFAPSAGPTPNRWGETIHHFLPEEWATGALIWTTSRSSLHAIGHLSSVISYRHRYGHPKSLHSTSREASRHPRSRSRRWNMLSDTQNFTLRPASLEDAPKLLEFIRLYYAYDGIPFGEPSIRRGLNTLLQDTSLGRAFLIQDGEEDAGYAILTFGFDLEFGGRQATVTDVFIKESHRSKGLESRVFAQLEQICRSLGIGALELQVEENNLEARAFYKTLGFQAHERIPMSKMLDAKRNTQNAKE